MSLLVRVVGSVCACLHVFVLRVRVVGIAD